jgi:radical SAM superfamily enzyme YgiQ (UPF0313 family)
MRLLFVNPYIHDFAAHDLWTHPLGLLYLAELAERWGFAVEILDLLDRHHPAWQRKGRFPIKTHANGTGPFHKVELEKPAAVGFLKRRFSRYGAPREAVEARLANMEIPDVVFCTSSMTYWYPGVAETVALLRRFFPQTPLVLGGTYATLLSAHARETVRPDLLIRGPGEKALGRYLSQQSKRELPPIEGCAPIFSLCRVWRHYPILKSYPLLTSRGCPFTCSFCAGVRLNPPFFQVDPKKVEAEIRLATQKLAQTELVFFDDALFCRPERHIKPLLRRVRELEETFRFHTPNGLLARFIDLELAELMAQCRFVRPRLSLETISARHGPRIDHKVDRKQYANAVAALHRAGYTAGDIVTYLLVGLVGQTIEEIREAVAFVHDVGSRVSLAYLSPIPATAEHEKAKLDPSTDPLLLSNTVYLAHFRPALYEAVESLRLEIKTKNERLG